MQLRNRRVTISSRVMGVVMVPILILPMRTLRSMGLCEGTNTYTCVSDCIEGCYEKLE